MKFRSYPWYLEDWRNSGTRLNLTLEERGLYRELLDFCYIERSLPTDERMLARIANCSDDEFQRAWPRVKIQFNEADGRLIHQKVEQVLAKLDGYREQRRQAGRLSGESRRNKTNERSSPVQVSLPKNPTKHEGNCEPSLSTYSIEEEPPKPPSLCASDDARVDGGSALPETPQSGYRPEWFEQWWTIYWRKVSRKPAEKAFRTHVRTEQRFQQVMSATKAQTPMMMAREAAHRPHGATWLNAERWADEVEAPGRAGPQQGRLYDSNAVGYPTLPKLRRS